MGRVVAYNASGTFPSGWLAFELSVLRRLKFSSIALPFTCEPDLCVQLKRWKVSVAANDPMIWAFTKATALVENAADHPGDEEIATILVDKEKGRPVRKLELHSQDGRLLSVGDTALKPRTAGKQRKRVTA